MRRVGVSGTRYGFIALGEVTSRRVKVFEGGLVQRETRRVSWLLGDVKRVLTLR